MGSGILSLPAGIAATGPEEEQTQGEKQTQRVFSAGTWLFGEHSSLTAVLENGGMAD